MVTNDTELFTADEVIELELYDAIKRGETKFEGHYECTKGKTLEFKQRAFVFTDKYGNLRIGKLIDDDEVISFVEYIKERELKENAI